MTRRKTTNPYDVPEDQRPREKLLRDPGGSSLSDAELLAIVLNTGTAGCPVFELALRMLCVFPSADAFANADWLEMKTCIAEWNAKNPASPIRGMGDAKLMRIAAAFQFVDRIRSRVASSDFRKAAFDPDSPENLDPVFRRILGRSPEKEHFYVLPIDAKLHPLCAPVDVSQGTITKTPVHPREVYCEATRYRARGIVVAHNHPDGDPEPSGEDFAVTRRLAEAGRILGIKLLDHLVLGAPGSAGGKGYVSIRNIHPEIFL